MRQQPSLASAMIVENDREARSVLSALLHRRHPGLRIVGHASSMPEGVAMARAQRPDIIFMEAVIGEMTAFDLLKAIAPHRPHAIFITTDASHAVRAIRFDALDYLLKPVVPEELDDAVFKALREVDVNHQRGLKPGLPGLPLGDHQITLPVRDGFIVLHADDIVHCTSDNNYTEVHTLHARKPHLITKPLSDLHGTLHGACFVRIHQSHLVNRKHILRYVKGEGGTVVMSSEHVLPVSRRQKGVLMQALKKNPT
jgi:two-component system LytT family response regulator